VNFLLNFHVKKRHLFNYGFKGKPLSDETDYSKHCAQGTDFSVERILLQNGSNLKTITFTPKSPDVFPPVIFVPGMASVIDNFSGTLIALTKNFIVHFVETRDKASSILSEKAGFDVADIASDISGAIEHFIPDQKEFILLTYSLGATAAAESFISILKKKPSLLLLIEPSGTFRIPKLGLFIANYFVWTYNIIKPLIKLYFRKFLVNTKEDYYMNLISFRVLDSADPRKLAATVLAISKYQIWSALEKIDVPTIVIGASQDTFHSLGEAMEISSHIKGSTYIDLVTNKRTHSQEVADCMIKLI
jgi:pimeloyl-ACP methyl ester carboxylesterase